MKNIFQVAAPPSLANVANESVSESHASPAMDISPSPDVTFKANHNDTKTLETKATQDVIRPTEYASSKK